MSYDPHEPVDWNKIERVLNMDNAPSAQDLADTYAELLEEYTNTIKNAKADDKKRKRLEKHYHVASKARWTLEKLGQQVSKTQEMPPFAESHILIRSLLFEVNPKFSESLAILQEALTSDDKNPLGYKVINGLEEKVSINKKNKNVITIKDFIPRLYERNQVIANVFALEKVKDVHPNLPEFSLHRVTNPKGVFTITLLEYGGVNV